jgi:hypothetical protein
MDEEVDEPIETPLVTANGERHTIRIRGRVLDQTGIWEGWVEFTDSNGRTVRTDRETTQPNRRDLIYWATGLSTAFYEGALERAINRRPESAARQAADSSGAVGEEPILDPFQVYAQGELLLRDQLSALSEMHLQNIVRAWDFGPVEAGADRETLVELILEGVRSKAEG